MLYLIATAAWPGSKDRTQTIPHDRNDGKGAADWVPSEEEFQRKLQYAGLVHSARI
jgi:hypothetical protein